MNFTVWRKKSDQFVEWHNEIARRHSRLEIFRWPGETPRGGTRANLQKKLAVCSGTQQASRRDESNHLIMISKIVVDLKDHDHDLKDNCE